MKLALCALALVMTAASNSVAGTITGIVRAEGKEGAEPDTAAKGYDSRKFKFIERINYAELRDFVVYIDQPIVRDPLPPAKTAQVVTQKDASFKPHVLPVVVGTTIEWPNQDEIFHNVFSYSDTKSFDLGLYKQEIKRVKFDKPGRVDVFCSIHSKMHCIILVLENPFFAMTSAKGIYAIANVPAGHYRLKAWHERLPAQTKDIVVPGAGDVNVDFTLGIKDLPKY